MLRRVRPGWYVLLALVAYALVVTLMLRASQAQVRDMRMAQVGAQQSAPVPVPGAPAAASGEGASATGALAATPADGLWFPLPGAHLPSDDANLPGAPRDYRNGMSQGFDFYDGDCAIPVSFGTPVIAAAGGEVVRADTAYVEMDETTWTQLLSTVARDGADAGQLDRLRGRQLWIRTTDGRVLRYGFLSGIREGVTQGRKVYRGEVIGFVGNSGTGDGVAGSTRNPRLHFEVWQGDTFFGEGLTPDDVRLQASSLFSGP